MENLQKNPLKNTNSLFSQTVFSENNLKSKIDQIQYNSINEISPEYLKKLGIEEQKFKEIQKLSKSFYLNKIY